MPQSRNIYYLERYNIFLSLALALVANLQLLDLLLLKIGFAIDRFGLIKSIMFLLPALSYQLAMPWIRRKHELSLCVYAYSIRIALPCLLPFLALLVDDKTILAAATMAVLGIGATLAALANNTLSVIYRRALPERNFNRLLTRMMFLFNLPALLITLPAAGVLSWCNQLPTGIFLSIFGLLEIASALFEIPAVRALRRVRLEEASQPDAAVIRRRDLLRPWFEPEYRNFLVWVGLRGMVSGLWSVYFVVYLYEARHWSTFSVLLTGTVLGIAGLGTALGAGRLADRINYPAAFLWLSLLWVAGGIATGLALDTGWGMALALLLIWDGTGSLPGMATVILEAAAAARLAAVEKTACYIAGFNLVSMLSRALGVLAADPILRSLSTPGQPYDFIGFFRISLLATLLLPLWAWRWRRTANECRLVE